MVPAVDGTYAPEELLSAFNGQELSGTWTFTVTDDEGGISGTVNALCVDPVVQ